MSIRKSSYQEFSAVARSAGRAGKVSIAKDGSGSARRLWSRPGWHGAVLLALSLVGAMALAVSPAGLMARLGPFQTGPGNRTVISTIAGGGLGISVPVLTVAMSQPIGVVLDPKGRGYYVLDERDGVGLVRFVNTTTAPVTVARVTIEPNTMNLLAGGGTGNESLPAREVDLGQITGMALDSSGDALYLLTPLTSSIRVLNVGTENFSLMRRTVTPGRVVTLFNTVRAEARGLAVNSRQVFFYTASSPGGAGRLVYQLDSRSDNPAEVVYAGGGNPPSGNGDGGLGDAARLINPLNVTIDQNDNLYIAEAGDTRLNPGRIRLVDSGQIISTIATNLEFPVGVAIGPGGVIYAALSNSQQIVRISAGGLKTVVAGDNSLLSCDQVAVPRCGDGGLAIAANLNIPGSTQLRGITLAADASGIYLPDDDYRRVRYINLTGTTVTITGVPVRSGGINTIAGSGALRPFDNVPATFSELQRPTGMAVDALGNLFISDTSATPVNLLRYVNRGTTPVTLFGGTAWRMTVQPGHIATLNHRVEAGRQDNRITTAAFLAPGGLAATSNGLYIVDSQYGALIRPAGTLLGRRSGHIRFLNTSSSPVTLFPRGGSRSIIVPPGEIRDVVGRNDSPGVDVTGDGGPAAEAVIFPSDVALDSAGNLYIADQGHGLIRVVNQQTGLIDSVRGGIGTADPEPLETNMATGIAIAGDRLYIADTRNDRILRQDTSGGTIFSVIANAASGVARPRDLAVDSSGNVLVMNNGNHRVLRIVAPANRIGTVTTIAGTGGAGYSGDGGRATAAQISLVNPGTAYNEVQYTTNIIVLPDSQILFADSNNNRIRLLTQEPNIAPQLGPLTEVTASEGSPVSFTVSANDANGDQLSFALTAPPGFVSLLDNGNGTATVTVNPGYESAGRYTITITVSDGDLSVAGSLALTVNDTNRPPTVSVAPIPTPQEALSAAGRQVVLTGSGSDPDGDQLSYQWFDGGLQIATTAVATVTLAPGNHSIFLRVSDSRGLSANSASQLVAVVDTTPPTILNIPPNSTSQAIDLNGVAVNYVMPRAVDLVDGELPVTADRPAGAVFPIGTTTVTLTARDSRGNTATASFTITVTPPGGGAGDYTINTYAGNGTSGSTGNGQQATAATFRQMVALGHDIDGNLLIADLLNRNFRRINRESGVITILAGNGVAGNTGDGGQAAFATFGQPGGVAADARGNIYVADTLHHRVRRIGSDGRISHFAGSSSGLAGSIGDNGPATSARLNAPTALAVDAAGNVYISDTGNNRIRMVNVTSGVISTYAGVGGSGFAGDGGPANSAVFNGLGGINFDRHGHLFIADRNNHRIRRIDRTTQLITTVVGDGTAGFRGDQGLATAAQLNSPSDVAVDLAGNIVIVDQGNHRLRLVSQLGQAGLISTIAGDGVAGFAGDGGLATLARLNQPRAIDILPDGRIQVADSGNLRVRSLTPNSPQPANSLPQLVAEIGNQSLTIGQTIDLPLLATDRDGDSVSFSLVNGPPFATIVAARPAERQATLRLAPTTVGVTSGVRIRLDDGRGGVSNSSAFTITVTEPALANRPPTVDPGAIPATIEAASAAGATVALAGSGTDPDGDTLTFVWFDNGQPIATTPLASVILSIGSHSLVLTVTDSRGATTSSTPRLVVVADTTPPVFQNLPANVTTSATSATGANVSYQMPSAVDLVDGPVTVTADRTPGALFPVGTTTVRFTATDTRGNSATASFTVSVNAPTSSGGGYKISTYAGTGASGTTGNGGPATEATFRQVTATGLDLEGNLIVADLLNRIFRRINGSTGTIAILAGNGVAGNTGDGGPATFATFGQPGGVAADSKGNIYVSDTLHHRVRRIASDGRIFHFAGTTTGTSGAIGDNGLATTARLSGPTALAVDADDNLYIADTGNSRIRVVNTTTGVITTYAGSGGGGFAGDNGPASAATLNGPSGLSFDASGHLYIADLRNHRIRRVDKATRLITTVAGNGAPGYGGDGGVATAAQLNQPIDVAVDASGNLLIADQANHRIRLVTASGVINTIAGDGTAGFAGDGGAASQARLNLPRSIDVSSGNTVYVGDSGNFRIRRLIADAPPPPPPPPPPTTLNRAPVITTPLPDRTLTVGDSLNIPLNATDEEGDNVTFALVNAPPFATIIDSDPSQRRAVLRLAPLAIGVFRDLRLRADDGRGGLTTSPPFSITVQAAPISITSLTNSSGRRGTTVNITINGEGFAQGANVAVSGGGVIAGVTSVTPTQLQVRLFILANAATTVRSLTIQNVDGGSVTRSNAFTVMR
ncbi:MAG: HYR domain-containing protein [Acidobacteriota bacterium]